MINSNDVNDCHIRISDKELYNHLVNARRVKQGETLLLIDENEVQYVTNIQEIMPREIYTKVVDSYKSNRKLDIDLYIAQSVLKPDAQFSLIQKVTELGTKGIIPLYTDNCTMKQSVIKAKADKWQKIALESVKQCERADVPKVFELSTIKEVIEKHDFDIIIAFVEKYADFDLNNYIKSAEIKNDASILAIIGPEGGFSEKEFEYLKENKIPMITLGNLIYRADTAAVVALSNLIYGIQNARL